jgi:hypothetical protein
LLYSICCHDAERKLVIPIAEFFTPNRTTTTIQCYLQKIKENFEKFSHVNVEYKSPSVFVTDESWATINAAIKVFNNSNIEIYLGLNPKFPKMFVSSLYIKNPPLSLAIFL